MHTHKVIYDPKQTNSFTGSHFQGTKEECEDWCKSTNGLVGEYFTYVVVENVDTFTVEQLVMKLIGPVRPVGEANSDDERFENLQKLTKLSSFLIEELQKIHEDFKENVAYSIKRASNFAGDYLESELINNLKVDEEKN